MIYTRLAENDDLEEISRVHNSAWKIEHKNFEDKERLQKLNRIFDPEKMKLRAEKIREAGTFPTRVFFQVASIKSDSAENIVGFIEARRGSIAKGVSTVAVERLYVAPEHHEKGVARELISDLLDWVYDGERLEIIVASYNQDNIDLYTRYGFRKNKEYIHSDTELSAIQMIAIVGADLREAIGSRP